MTHNFPPEYYRKQSLADLYSIRDNLRPGTEPRVVVERVIQEKEDFKKTVADATELLNRYTDKLVGATESVWNVLITLQGIFIGAFSVLAAFDKMNRILALFLMGCSFFSSMFLVYNFITLRRMYSQMLQKLHSEIQEKLGVGENDISQRKTEAKRRYRFEVTAQFLLLVESIALLAFVYFTIK